MRSPTRRLTSAGTPEAAREMIDLTGQRGVPVVVIDDHVVVGFDQPRISELLHLTPKTEVPADHELIIIGSGTAGLAAAMYAG